MDKPSLEAEDTVLPLAIDRSDRAVKVNIEIMRTFVKLRGMLAELINLKEKLTQLENKYDDFRMVF